jgi:hypothetical protein
MKRLHPFTRCVLTIARDGIARAKPVSCFSAGAQLRYRVAKAGMARIHAAEHQEKMRRDILQRITDLCMLTNALAAATTAAEGLLGTGARDEAGGLVVDEAEALKVRAAIAWAQDVARAKQGEMHASTEAPAAQPAPEVATPRQELQARTPGVCEDCGSTEATLGPCPYDVEVHNDCTPVWLCSYCANKRAIGITPIATSPEKNP